MSGFLDAEAASFAIGGATLLDRIDLRIDRGELIAIVGPNGAGKSTLLRLLSGDLRPTRGAVSLQQRAIHSYAPRELASRRAMLSQHVNVSFPFTVEEVVWMGAGDRGRGTSQSLVDAALHEVGLDAFRDRQLPTLSGGEQQRAHFARVLVQLRCGEVEHGPGLLLLDEPTSSLDLRHQIDLAGTARRCARNGTTVIAILHDINLAARFADRIVVLHQGRLAADGAPSQVIENSLIRRVFDIALVVRTAEDGVPFLLPQMIDAARPQSEG
ncbi:heme ABC transporter ATP-binding protein [Rhodopseudomonas palustris]|uniref:Hemin import ATP-binding protein HmuV n=1 Tax=Rhodopseudomonas palustris (strain BisB18) TaxID=316056 RepID=HMUV_RHOPB|nr:RecName: Full=Hemin import ATP-binding protein HmuV [Rhodopseudomonas palustris BisB18]